MCLKSKPLKRKSGGSTELFNILQESGSIKFHAKKASAHAVKQKANLAFNSSNGYVGRDEDHYDARVFSCSRPGEITSVRPITAGHGQRHSRLYGHESGPAPREDTG